MGVPVKIMLEVVGHFETREVKEFDLNGKKDLACGEESTSLILRNSSGGSFVVKVPETFYSEVVKEIRENTES